jgi:hypothetical protein
MPDSDRDVLTSFEPIISARPEGNPWTTRRDGTARFKVDYELLEQLLSIPVGELRTSASGRLAKAIDAWVASEIRRAGFPPDEVWPRLEAPRVLPREVGLFVARLPQAIQQQARDALLRDRKVAPSDARVLGRAYVKQVDVLMAQWARGPELLVSTKSMVGSFRNNIANRFEESYGDAKNLRGRHPLAAMGFLFVLRSTILDDPGSFEKALDMLRKLRAEEDVYDATCVVVADWDDQAFCGVRLVREAVPDDLEAGRFLTTLVEAVLARTPVEMHVEARSRREHRILPLEESDTGAIVDPGFDQIQD